MPARKGKSNRHQRTALRLRARPASRACWSASGRRPAARCGSTASTSSAGARTNSGRTSATCRRRSNSSMARWPRTSRASGRSTRRPFAPRRHRSDCSKRSRMLAGFDTRIGEEGAVLSGGQRQRLARRAIFGDPRLIVLDEPNASLDEAGEKQQLISLLQQLRARGATVLVIAHRQPDRGGGQADGAQRRPDGRLRSGATTCSRRCRRPTRRRARRSRPARLAPWQRQRRNPCPGVRHERISGRSALGRALWSFRREFFWVGVFSFFANLLMLTPTLYMLQVFDRVLISGSALTLAGLTLIALFFFLVMGFAEWLRSRLLVRAGARFDEALNRRVFDAASSTVCSRAVGSPCSRSTT